LFYIKLIFHILQLEAVSVTTPCLLTQNYNDERQAPLQSARLAQPSTTSKLLHVR